MSAAAVRPWTIAALCLIFGASGCAMRHDAPLDAKIESYCSTPVHADALTRIIAESDRPNGTYRFASDSDATWFIRASQGVIATLRTPMSYGRIVSKGHEVSLIAIGTIDFAHRDGGRLYQGLLRVRGRDGKVYERWRDMFSRDDEPVCY